MRQARSKLCTARPRPRSVLETMVSGLLNWFRASARDLPWRRTQDPYAIWVSEVMLQQTQVKTVIPYWERWMQALPTIGALAAANLHTVHKLWEGLGYYSRARNLHRAAGVIVQAHGGVFPQDPEQIRALPGIGPYTAGAIRSIALNHPAPIVDGNVARVLSRVFLVRGDPRTPKASQAFWGLAEELVRKAAVHPGRACSDLNQGLMELGALVCTPAAPVCGVCPLADLCEARKTGKQTEFPQLKARQRPTERRFIAVVVEEGGKFLVRQRPTGVVNAHLWEFPNLEVRPATKPAHVVRRIFGHPAADLEPLCAIRHSITRYRITLDVVRARVNGGGHDGQWLTPSQLQELPFASAHKKILQKLSDEQTNSRSNSHPKNS